MWEACDLASRVVSCTRSSKILGSAQGATGALRNHSVLKRKRVLDRRGLVVCRRSAEGLFNLRCDDAVGFPWGGVCRTFVAATATDDDTIRAHGGNHKGRVQNGGKEHVKTQVW